MALGSLPPQTTPAPAAPTASALEMALDDLYRRTKERMGEEDLVYIRRVAAYSQAIEARSRQLLHQGGKNGALARGALLHALHILLEFSELGHNIMHGSYDNLPGVGEFHSDRWKWDFVTDPHEWKVMHHRNHHPYTNIVGKDHDLGYSIARLLPGQNWYGHHGVQPAILLLLIFHLYHFTIYTAISAARVERQPILRWDTFRRSASLIGAHLREKYFRDPLSAKGRFLHTLLGNYVGTTLGYDLTILILAFEHHADNVKVFADPGPSETREAYFRRQVAGTTNFIPMAAFDRAVSKLLEEEVPFENRPPMAIFYGGLETHLEHHLFPDLPCQRQREIAPEVKAICEAHGLPYNVMALEQLAPRIFKELGHLALPIGEFEVDSAWKLMLNPLEVARRLRAGMRYSVPSPSTYFRGARFYNAPAKILAAKPLANGQALHLQLQRPQGWEDVSWEAGAFVSIRVELDGKPFVRQYSLLADSTETPYLEFAVKRVDSGRVSNFLNDHGKAGKHLTLVGPPQNDGTLVVPSVPPKALYIAGGIGITPFLSMLRRTRREAPFAEATLLYFNRSEASTVFASELAELATHGSIRVHSFVDEGSVPSSRVPVRRLSRELVAETVGDLTGYEVFVCAPSGFIELARAVTQELGVSPHRFHVESFRPPQLQRSSQPSTKHHRIRFLKSQREVTVDGNTTLLEAARSAGLDLPSGCERGLCKACVCPKVFGATETAGAVSDKPLRTTLCNSFPHSDVDLDA